VAELGELIAGVGRLVELLSAKPRRLTVANIALWISILSGIATVVALFWTANH
jgi:hypothetical protein